MSNTSRLKLPYILESQAQKEITHNEALEIIDVLLHAAAISIGNTPPESAKPGDCYIIHDNKFAYYTNGWNFIEPFEGLTVWVKDERQHYTYCDNKWVASTRTSTDINKQENKN